MKKLLLLLIIPLLSFGQLPPNSWAEDFTVTDINGDEFNLYATLDEGKTVILNLFATWCAACYSVGFTSALMDLQNTYPDDVVCIAIEADPSTPENTIFGEGNSVGDFSNMFPLIADDPTGNILEDYALTYYPTTYKICPDRMVTELGQVGLSDFISEVNLCSGAQYGSDPKIISYNGDTELCEGSFNGSVIIQNYGFDVLTTCDILTKVEGSLIDTYNWSGSLVTYQTDTVELGIISGIPDNSEINFEIFYNSDQDESNNSVNPVITSSEESSIYVSLKILTDDWPGETSWELIDPDGNVIESTNVVFQELNQKNGDYSGNPYTEFIYDWELDLIPGCYRFNVYDSYGDGVAGVLSGGQSDGLVTLTDLVSGNIFFSTFNFGFMQSFYFSVNNSGFGFNLDEKVHPKKLKTIIDILGRDTNSKGFNIEIYDDGSVEKKYVIE